MSIVRFKSTVTWFGLGLFHSISINDLQLRKKKAEESECLSTLERAGILSHVSVCRDEEARFH